MKITVIGGGHMGSTLGRAFLTHRLLAPQDLLIIESSEPRIEQLMESLRCRVKRSIDAEVAESRVVLLSVKPQDAAHVCRDLVPRLAPDQLVLSIMAGVSVASLQSWLGAGRRVVRSMPNLSARCGQAMSVFYAPSGVPKEEIDIVRSLLNAFGKSLLVNDELMVDAATSLA